MTTCPCIYSTTCLICYCRSCSYICTCNITSCRNITSRCYVCSCSYICTCDLSSCCGVACMHCRFSTKHISKFYRIHGFENEKRCKSQSDKHHYKKKYLYSYIFFLRNRSMNYCLYRCLSCSCWYSKCWSLCRYRCR